MYTLKRNKPDKAKPRRALLLRRVPECVRNSSRIDATWASKQRGLAHEKSVYIYSNPCLQNLIKHRYTVF